MKKYLLIVECAIECNGKYLIILRPKEKYAGDLLSFAGGRVEQQDENDSFDMLRSAVKREVFEELGLVLDGPINYITSEYFVDNVGICTINNLFHYKYNDVPTVTPCESEVPWFGWMTKEEINGAPNAPEWLKKLITLI